MLCSHGYSIFLGAAKRKALVLMHVTKWTRPWPTHTKIKPIDS